MTLVTRAQGAAAEAAPGLSTSVLDTFSFQQHVTEGAIPSAGCVVAMTVLYISIRTQAVRPGRVAQSSQHPMVSPEHCKKSALGSLAYIVPL